MITNPTLALLPLLVLAGLAACSPPSPAEANGATAAPVVVKVLKAERQTRDVVSRFSGYVHPWDTHGLGFLVGGRVSAILVEQGDRVTRGQLLATIDSTDYQLVQQLAETQVQAIEPNYERVDSLVAKDVLPQSELDVLAGRYNAAKTQVNQATRQVAHTRLISPVSGVVHELRTAVGQVIGQGSPAVIVLQLDKVKVKFGVTQKDLPRFKMDDCFEIEFDGIDKPVRGTIVHLDYVADSMTRTFGVVLEVANADHLLRPGMIGRLNVLRKQLEGFFVPIGAVVRDTEGAYTVKVVNTKSSTVESVPVTIGERFGEELQITTGLEGEELVITSGNNIAAIGDKVEIR
jgi:RND family efflux transporter MFP subunit